MAGKVEVYQSITTVHNCRLYSDDIRTLFKLPRRKGKIVSIELVGQTIHANFEVERHRYINHKLTGGK